MTEQAQQQAQLKIQLLNQEKEEARVEHQQAQVENQKKLGEQQLSWQNQFKAGNGDSVDILETDMDAMAL